MSTDVKETTMSMPAAPAPQKKRKTASLDRKKARAGWFFVLPFLIGLVFIYFPVIVNSLRFTLGEAEFTRDAQNVTQMTYVWKGFEYYSEALFGGSGEFAKVLIAGLKQLLIDVPAIVIFSLFMAVMLNQKMFGRAAFRAIFFIPVIVSTGVIAEQDASNALLSYMSGGSSIDTGDSESTVSQIVSATDINALFSNMAVGSEFAVYVSDLVNNIYAIINRSGVQMLIFLAGLQSISGAIYESCSIDGASAWETFWKITLPMVSPMILVNAIYTVIDAFTSSSNSVMQFINKTYSSAGGAFLSSAMAWIYFSIVILAIVLVWLILRVFVFYQRRD